MMSTRPGGGDETRRPASPGDAEDPGGQASTQLGWRLPTEPEEPEEPAAGEARAPGDADTRPRPAATDPRRRSSGFAETQLRAPGFQQTLPGGGGAQENRSAYQETHQRPGSGEEVVHRFGPGLTGAPKWSGPAPRRRRSPKGGVLFGGLALAAVLAFFLLWRPDPVVLTGAEVAPAAPVGQACDVTVDVVGTIRTNGRAGTIGYRWLRSDGESSEPLTQTVEAGQTSAQVHLFWTLSGKGRYPATATLEITQPQPLTATGGFTYSCR
jgi:hypothetical protein